MTLIVSLRIPDGIVIAGDSLATVVGQGQLNATIGVNCPECGHNHEVHSQFPMPQMPATTFSYAQKVFSIYKNFGVGIFGTSLIGDKSVYFAMRVIEKSIPDLGTKGIDEVANRIGHEIHSILPQHIDMNTLQDDQSLLGFQIVGYDGEIPKTIDVNIGKSVNVNQHVGLGCHCSGRHEVVTVLSQLYRDQPGAGPLFPVFSVQDAINYAQFLIGTTIAHQQFSAIMPDVGGHIDVALVTPFDEFKWIHEKEFGGLNEIFGGKSE